MRLLLEAQRHARLRWRALLLLCCCAAAAAAISRVGVQLQRETNAEEQSRLTLTLCTLQNAANAGNCCTRCGNPQLELLDNIKSRLETFKYGGAGGAWTKMDGDAAAQTEIKTLSTWSIDGRDSEQYWMTSESFVQPPTLNIAEVGKAPASDFRLSLSLPSFPLSLYHLSLSLSLRIYIYLSLSLFVCVCMRARRTDRLTDRKNDSTD